MCSLRSLKFSVLILEVYLFKKFKLHRCYLSMRLSNYANIIVLLNICLISCLIMVSLSFNYFALPSSCPQMLVSSAMVPAGATRSSPSRNTISKHATVLLCLADILRPASRDRSAARWAADAANECEQCGAVQPLVAAAAASPDAACRAAGGTSRRQQ